MAKKLTSIRIEPDVVKKLKHLSVDIEKPIGDVIGDLMEFSESGEYLKICPKCKSAYEEAEGMEKK